ncbi:MAG: hypothetical protein E7646_09975 [Ruminococcaceae bacterium]|nr:hypothetical protein [Oscillospiraceae bacterium]
MKFSIFTDIHHYPGRYMGGTIEDLELIEKRALENNCDFVIHAGDFCHKPLVFKDFLKRYSDFSLPVYHVMGNHDFDHADHRESLEAYGLESAYYYFDCKGYRFIALDCNYYLHNGEYFPYSNGDYFNFSQGREYLPPEQIAWLERTLQASPYPCIIISHSSLERGADGIKNQREVRKVIDQANKNRKHSVLLCINGHHHKDHASILNGVCYLDLNSASFDPLDAPHPHYPKALTDEFSVIQHTLVYNDPIHAIITLEGSSIKVEGMESSLLLGVGKEMTSDEMFDRSGRETTARIQSFEISL